jgi:hypothetical protein
VLILRACLIPCAAGDSLNSDVVDIFNATSGDWSTAKLSVARAYPAAASLPDHGLAIFAGGWSALCCCDFRCVAFVLVCVENAYAGAVICADFASMPHALRSGKESGWQQCLLKRRGLADAVPHRPLLHRRQHNMRPLRPRQSHRSRRPSQVRVLRGGHVRQRVWPLALLPLPHRL